MESQSIEPLSPTTESAPPEEIRHVPLWVKGIVAGGAVLFLIQIPSFTSSLSDATQKSRASAAYDKGQYLQAIDLYKALHARYPADKELIKQLGFAHYRAGQYLESISAFDQLAGAKLPKRDVEEINSLISDISARLNLQTK
jgi:tetratricopeptide (TPR) repeat protein